MRAPEPAAAPPAQQRMPQQSQLDRLMNTGNPQWDAVMCVACCCCKTVEKVTRTFGRMDEPYPVPWTGGALRLFCAMTLCLSVVAVAGGCY